MPAPSRYKGEGAKKRFMQQCMHTTKQEGLTPEQGLGKCLNMWRGEKGGKPAPKRKKKALADIIRIQANDLTAYKPEMLIEISASQGEICPARTRILARDGDNFIQLGLIQKISLTVDARTGSGSLEAVLPEYPMFSKQTKDSISQSYKFLKKAGANISYTKIG